MTSMLRWHPCWDDIHADTSWYILTHDIWKNCLNPLCLNPLALNPLSLNKPSWHYTQTTSPSALSVIFHIGTPSSYLCVVCFRNILFLTWPLICPVYFLAWCICGTNVCRHQKISVAGSSIIAKVGCFHQDKCQVNFDPATDCSVFGSSCESSPFYVKIKKFYHC